MFYFEPLSSLLANAVVDCADRARRANRLAEAKTLIDLAYLVFTVGAVPRPAGPAQTQSATNARAAQP